MLPAGKSVPRIHASIRPAIRPQLMHRRRRTTAALVGQVCRSCRARDLVPRQSHAHPSLSQPGKPKRNRGPGQPIVCNMPNGLARTWPRRFFPSDSQEEIPAERQIGSSAKREAAIPDPALSSMCHRIDVVQTITAFPSMSDAQEEIPTTDADKSPHGCTQKDRPQARAPLP